MPASIPSSVSTHKGNAPCTCPAPYAAPPSARRRRGEWSRRGLVRRSDEEHRDYRFQDQANATDRLAVEFEEVSLLRGHGAGVPHPRSQFPAAAQPHPGIQRIVARVGGVIDVAAVFDLVQPGEPLIGQGLRHDGALERCG